MNDSTQSCSEWKIDEAKNVAYQIFHFPCYLNEKLKWRLLHDALDILTYYTPLDVWLWVVRIITKKNIKSNVLTGV